MKNIIKSLLIISIFIYGCMEGQHPKQEKLSELYGMEAKDYRKMGNYTSFGWEGLIDDPLGQIVSFESQLGFEQQGGTPEDCNINGLDATCVDYVDFKLGIEKRPDYLQHYFGTTNEGYTVVTTTQGIAWHVYSLGEWKELCMNHQCTQLRKTYQDHLNRTFDYLGKQYQIYDSDTEYAFITAKVQGGHEVYVLDPFISLLGETPDYWVYKSGESYPDDFFEICMRDCFSFFGEKSINSPSRIISMRANSSLPIETIPYDYIREEIKKWRRDNRNVKKGSNYNVKLKRADIATISTDGNVKVSVHGKVEVWGLGFNDSHDFECKFWINNSVNSQGVIDAKMENKDCHVKKAGNISGQLVNITDALGFNWSHMAQDQLDEYSSEVSAAIEDIRQDILGTCADVYKIVGLRGHDGGIDVVSTLQSGKTINDATVCELNLRKKLYSYRWL